MALRRQRPVLPCRVPQCKQYRRGVCMLDKQGRVRQGSIDQAAGLVRELMAHYGIPADRVVRHYDVTHKLCPAPMVSDPALWENDALPCGHTAAQTVNGTEFDGRYFGGNTGQNHVTLPIRHRSLDILTDEGELVAVLEACDCESVTVSPCIHSGNDRGDPRGPAFISDDDIIAVEPAFVTSHEQQPCA